MVHNFLDIESKGVQKYQVTKKTTCLLNRQYKERLKFCKGVYDMGEVFLSFLQF
jgi:hypothetical protein